MRLRDDSGQSLVFFGALIGAFFVLMLVVVDGTHAFQQRRNLQNAADAAALAAAWDLSRGDVASMGPDAAEYSNANNGPAAVSSDMPRCDDVAGPTTNCFVTPYIDETGPQPMEVEVRLHISCIPTFFGKVANVVTGSNSFECVAESAHAVAMGWSSGAQVPYRFVALMSDGENQTLRVDASAKLTVDNGIYVNACANDPASGSCPGGPSPANSSAFQSNSLTSAARASVVGGWSGAPNSLWVDGQNCQGFHFDSGSPPTGCPLEVGADAFPDPYQSLGGRELLGAPPAPDSCALCQTVSVLKITRSHSTGVVKVWVDPMPSVSAGMKISLRNIAVNGSVDHSFDENTYVVQSTDPAGDWILLGPPQNQGPVSDVPAPITVSSWSLKQGIASLGTDQPHGISGGDPITVHGVDANIEGSFVADSPLDPNSTSLTFQDSATSTYDIASEELSAANPVDGSHTATITLKAGETLTQDVGNDKATVDSGDPAFDGSYTIGAGSAGSTVVYTPAVAPIQVQQAQINWTSGALPDPSDCPGLSPPCAMLTVGQPLAAGEKVTITTGTAPYTMGSTVTVLANPAPTSLPGGDYAFWYTPSTIAADCWSADPTASTVTVHTPAVLDPNIKRVNVSGAGLPFFVAVADKGPVTVSVDRHSLTWTSNSPHSGSDCPAAPFTVAVTRAQATSYAGNPAAKVVIGSIPAHAPTGGNKTVTAPVFIAGKTCGPPLGCGTVQGGGGAPVDPPGELSLTVQGSEFQPWPTYLNTDKTLHPGTYYGGICLGGTDGASCGFQHCNSKPGPGPTITMTDGIYVIASGGFYACGNVNVVGENGKPAHIMIFNTDDLANNGLIGHVVFNTAGSVQIAGYEAHGNHPEYDGLTIYQDRNDVNEFGSDTGIHPQVTNDFTNVLVDPSGSGMNTTSTRLDYTGGQLRIGDVIQVGNEYMLVTALQGATRATVVRGFLDRPGYPAPATSHGAGDAIHYVSFAGATCQSKSPEIRADDWDVAFLHTKEGLDSFAGTIYVPGPRAMFGTGSDLDGTADLSVFSSCISINGDDTFNVHPSNVPTEFHSSLVG